MLAKISITAILSALILILTISNIDHDNFAKLPIHQKILFAVLSILFIASVLTFLVCAYVFIWTRLPVQ